MVVASEVPIYVWVHSTRLAVSVVGMLATIGKFQHRSSFVLAWASHQFGLRVALRSWGAIQNMGSSFIRESHCELTTDFKWTNTGTWHHSNHHSTRHSSTLVLVAARAVTHSWNICKLPYFQMCAFALVSRQDFTYQFPALPSQVLTRREIKMTQGTNQL